MKPTALHTGVTARTGAALLSTLQTMGEGVMLLAAACRRMRFHETDRERIAAQLVRVGTDTVPIAAILSLFVGMVLVVQSADQLRNVSQSVLGPIVGLAMTKEMGPVMMGFLLAGRTGSSIAAELGSMTVYDEISALRTMDIDPVRFLVVPRIVAAAIALPVLVLYADFVGILGGAAVVAVDPGIQLSVPEYFARMMEWVKLSDVLVGLVKGFAFGIVAAVVPCTFGLRTRGGAEGIAASTTAAVVWSFVWILILDFLIVRLSYRGAVSDRETHGVAVVLDGIHKRYGGQEVLAGVDLEVASRRAARDPRPERSGEVGPAAPDRRPRAAGRREPSPWAASPSSATSRCLRARSRSASPWSSRAPPCSAR